MACRACGGGPALFSRYGDWVYKAMPGKPLASVTEPRASLGAVLAGSPGGTRRSGTLSGGERMANQSQLPRDLTGPSGQGDVRAGNLEVRLAATVQEVDGAQALRYRVFYDGMGGKPSPEALVSRRDRDRFDEYCDHLLVIDHGRGSGSEAIVGTYRLLRRSIAERQGGFYTATEFDITPLLAVEGELLELGRSCVEAAYRTRPTMQLLWRGIGEYCFRHDIKLMFGCASLPGTDTRELAPALTYLHHYHLAPPVRASQPLTASLMNWPISWRHGTMMASAASSILALKRARIARSPDRVRPNDRRARMIASRVLESGCARSARTMLRNASHSVASQTRISGWARSWVFRLSSLARCDGEWMRSSASCSTCRRMAIRLGFPGSRSSVMSSARPPTMPLAMRRSMTFGIHHAVRSSTPS